MILYLRYLIRLYGIAPQARRQRAAEAASAEAEIQRKRAALRDRRSERAETAATVATGIHGLENARGQGQSKSVLQFPDPGQATAP